MRKRKYVVMWTYIEGVGYNSGNRIVYAFSRTHAMKIFYKYNRKLIIGTNNGKPVYNKLGGYVVDVVLTMKEWKAEGCPAFL
jgi:hypothetical protein